MTTPLGLSSTGFRKKELPELIAEVKVEMTNIFGSGLILDESSPDMQQMGVLANRLVEMWDVLLEVWNQIDPETATGVSLDRVNGSVRGVPRILDSHSTATVQLVGDADTLIAAGSLVKSPTHDAVFALKADVTLDDDGNGTGIVECTVGGAIPVDANSLTEIVTPVSGWDAVNNSTAGVVGRAAEQDPEYRVRGRKSTALRSQSMIESLEAALFAIVGVSSIQVYENREDTVDANGMDPKSIACFVKGGVDQDIFDAIFAKVNFGPKILGDVTGYGVDVRGISHPVAFYRPTDINIIIQVDVTESIGWALYKVEDIKKAIVDYFAGELFIGNITPGYSVGQDARASDLYAAVAAVGGFYLDSIEIKKTGGAFGPSVTIAWDELAIVDQDDISVTHV